MVLLLIFGYILNFWFLNTIYLLGLLLDQSFDLRAKFRTSDFDF